MSPKLPVPPLQEITLSLVARQLIHALSRVSSEEDSALEFAMVSSYYESMGATTDIFQDLVNLILSSEYLEPSVRFYTMKLLLKENVKSLATGIFPLPYYRKVLELIMEQGHHLTALNLKGVWVKEDHLPIMYQLLKNLPNLTVLNIPYIANDEVLKYIGKYNKVLKLLDISGETDITEIGIDAMLRGNPQLTQSLTVVNIGMYGEENIDHTDVALLIRRLPNLTNLGSYSFVGKAIYSIYNTDPDFKTKLQYMHDVQTNMRTMKAIIALCPMIETIYLEEPDQGVLQQIKELNSVNKIKLNKFQCHELHQLLDKIGHKIESLMLSASTGSFNFTRVAETCRNLESLEFYQIQTATHEEEIPFNSLEHIEIIHGNLSTSCLKYLMTGTPKLKKLIIGDEIKLDDNDMSRMLRRYKFDNLEGIWFPNAPRLTSQTVDLLIECCPKLTSLGQLSGWQFTPDDMMLMRAITASTNTDIVLSPLGIFQQGR
uniref:F-box domain-containing protein n=1 Tax=Heliothis virescens TaxID=7102 RepID=A0A2A4K0C4_HELVI